MMQKIELIPIKAHKIITKEDNLLESIIKSFVYNEARLCEKDILIVNSKIIATCEGRQVDLSDVIVSNEARVLAQKYSIDPQLTQLIYENAHVIFGGVPKVLLTEIYGNMIANAGIDKSNSGGSNIVILWPKEPYKSAEYLRNELMKYYSISNLGLIVSDSHVSPMRQGVVGSAIGVAGFVPVENCIGRKDLFNHTMEYTKRAIADQVTTAAHLLTGECDERIPLVVARGVSAEFTDKKASHSEIYMPFEKCLFMNSLRDYFEARR